MLANMYLFATPHLYTSGTEYTKYSKLKKRIMHFRVPAMSVCVLLISPISFTTLLCDGPESIQLVSTDGYLNLLFTISACLCVREWICGQLKQEDRLSSTLSLYLQSWVWGLPEPLGQIAQGGKKGQGWSEPLEEFSPRVSKGKSQREPQILLSARLLSVCPVR